MNEKRTNVAGVVFDFDNTICLRADGTGSDEIKDAVWPEVFGEILWKDIGPVFVSIVKRFSGGKGSRYDIVRSALGYSGVTQREMEDEVTRHCARFNTLVQKGILAIGIPSENRAYLQALSKRIPLFINSATPTKAMGETLQKLGIATLFRMVYGQEVGKISGLRKALIAVGATDPQKLLFVGDSISDYEAAHVVGTQFIGVATKHNGWKEYPQAFQTVSGVAEIVL